MIWADKSKNDDDKQARVRRDTNRLQIIPKIAKIRQHDVGQSLKNKYDHTA